MTFSLLSCPEQKKKKKKVGARDGGREKNSAQMPSWLHFQNLCFKHQNNIYLSRNSDRGDTHKQVCSCCLGNTGRNTIPQSPLCPWCQFSLRYNWAGSWNSSGLEQHSAKARKAAACLLVVPVDIYQTNLFWRESPLNKLILFLLLCFAKDCCRRWFSN